MLIDVLTDGIIGGRGACLSKTVHHLEAAAAIVQSMNDNNHFRAKVKVFDIWCKKCGWGVKTQDLFLSVSVDF